MHNPTQFTDIQPENRMELRPWREFALLMLVGMEVSWVTPWFRSLTTATYAIPPWQAVLILTTIMLVSLWAVRLMEFLRLRTAIRQVVTFGLLLIGVLVGLKTLLYPNEGISIGQMFTRPIHNMADVRVLIPDEFVVAMTVLIGWWRGIALAQERVGPAVVRDHVVVGVAMYVLFGFFNTMVTGETPGSFIYIFTFCSLLGMAAARLSVLGSLRGGRLTEFDRRWFIGVLLASTVTVSLATFLGNLFSLHVEWIAYIILGIFGSIALLIWMILTPFLAMVIEALNRDASGSPFVQQISDQVERFQEMMRGLIERISSFVGVNKLAEIITRWAPGIKLVLLASIIVLIVVGILIWVALQLWKERKRKQLAEEQLELYTQKELWHLLQEVLRQRWKNLLTGLTNVTDLHKRARLRAAQRIRQVYADLMDLCAELGKPRPEAVTPLEFLPDLFHCFPTHEDHLKLITQAYIRVRYGELPEDLQEVQGIEEAWKLFQKTGKEMLARQKREKNQPGHMNVKSLNKPRMNQ